MPTVYIWSPNRRHPFGHATVQTNKYHISFWPDGDVKEELGTLPAALRGVKGCLVFHPSLDEKKEGNRLPTGMHEIVNTTDEAINSIYEEFLRYNSINPLEVTLEAGKVLADVREIPERSVPKTKYSFIAAVKEETLFESRFSQTMRLLNVRRARDPFYHHKQSCVSFCFNLINGADPNPQAHMPLPVTEMMTSLVPFSGDISQYSSNVVEQSPRREPNGIFTVDWFEKYVVEHWVAGAEPNKCTIT